MLLKKIRIELLKVLRRILLIDIKVKAGQKNFMPISKLNLLCLFKEYGINYRRNMLLKVAPSLYVIFS